MPRPGLTIRTRQTRAWSLLILGGVLSAAHIWKLAGALPALLADFRMSLVTAGVLFAIIQAASIVGGLPVAWLASATGVKRLACAGLVLLAAASAAGAAVDSHLALVLLRGLEGVGFLTFTVLAPSLIATHSPPSQRDFAVGAWATFQGTAAFLGLALTPIVLTVLTWRGWWLWLASATLLLALLLMVVVPPDARVSRDLPGEPGAGAPGRWGITSVLVSLRSRETWLAGAAFACYSGPWLAVLGFLPTVLDGADRVGPGSVGMLAGGVGLANAAGALLGARFMQAGVNTTRLLLLCFGGSAVSVACAFLVDVGTSTGVLWITCWLAVFSALGGTIAAVLTRLGVVITPRASSPPVTFGLMQQIFNVGNLAAPPLLAVLVGAVEGWQGSVLLVTGAAVVGVACVLLLARRQRRRVE